MNKVLLELGPSLLLFKIDNSKIDNLKLYNSKIDNSTIDHLKI